MEFKWVKGKYGKKDRIILITTTKDEPITLLKVLTLVKLLGENEMKVHKKTINITDRFYFKLAIIDVLSGKSLKEIAKTYKLDIKKATRIDKELKEEKLSFFI